jgi:sugar phosphate isomerase/epimerase
MSSSRRAFLKSSAAGISTLGLFSAGRDPDFRLGQPERVFSDHLSMGIAGYTFHNYSVDQAIAMMQLVNMTSLSIKDFHLPLDSTPEKISEVLGKFQAAGITVYAAGVIYMKTTAEADLAFDYARRIGVKLIIGSPTYELLPYVASKVKATDIRMAIHNHGPEDKLYPGPGDIYDRIKALDPGMGICLDIGHAVRAGVDPVQAVRDYSTRIFDLHIKDVYEATPQDKPAIVGRGIIDFPGLVGALKKINFQGSCSIEYELPGKDPIPGIAESVGYFRGVDKSVR